MNKLIQEHDLLPLKKDIIKINEFKSDSPLSWEYIDYLEKMNIFFFFKQQAYDNDIMFTNDTKKKFIKHLNSKKFGFFKFTSDDNLFKQNLAENFLDTFIGKNFNELKKVFDHVEFPNQICEFYKCLNLVVLNSQEKKFFKEIIKPFHPQDKIHTIGLILHHVDISFLIKNHSELFEKNKLNDFWKEWSLKVDNFEISHFSMFSEPSVNVHDELCKKAKVFILRLAGIIIFKQNTNMIKQLFIDYEGAISQEEIHTFFKNNKFPEMNTAFNLYSEYIKEFENSQVSIEEINLIQKKLTVNIASIMQKNLLSYDKTCDLLKSIFNFFKTQPDFEHSLLTFNEENKKCNFCLTSHREDYLKNGKEFLSQVLNNKEIFTEPDKYKALFQYIHLDGKFESKNIKSHMKKI